MNKETIKDIIYIIIAIVLSILAVKFMIWALPIILVAALAYIIYREIKKNKNGGVNNKKEKNVKVIHDLDDEK